MVLLRVILKGEKTTTQVKKKELALEKNEKTESTQNVKTFFFSTKSTEPTEPTEYLLALTCFHTCY